MENILYVVSTPIGNLKDITLRALDVLKEADFIACEDTRVSSNLLKHYDIHKELISVNAFNEKNKLDYVITRIKQVNSAALISDAGTPGFSDPGLRLISAAIKEDIKIVPIPGPTAMAAALTISGLPLDSFLFEGFLPQKKGRQKKLKELAEEERTIVVYESVYRIEKLINELNEYMPNRHVVVCRELTKMFEETWRGTPAEILELLPQSTIKGEFAVVLAPLR
ncbi:MAG: 16S rRNA (cytidine(1402)-2'-O)-methyltransferase [Bacteroidota bacterium]|nr:16S rRNA (cytidine(1402)-2'-O)-methyltransferase [Bacteroidota bacterium]